jgi:hypothetical protein
MPNRGFRRPGAAQVVGGFQERHELPVIVADAEDRDLFQSTLVRAELEEDPASGVLRAGDPHEKRDRRARSTAREQPVRTRPGVTPAPAATKRPVHVDVVSEDRPARGGIRSVQRRGSTRRLARAWPGRTGRADATRRRRRRCGSGAESRFRRRREAAPWSGCARRTCAPGCAGSVKFVECVDDRSPHVLVRRPRRELGVDGRPGPWPPASTPSPGSSPRRPRRVARLLRRLQAGIRQDLACVDRVPLRGRSRARRPRRRSRSEGTSASAQDANRRHRTRCG